MQNQTFVKIALRILSLIILIVMMQGIGFSQNEKNSNGKDQKNPQTLTADQIAKIKTILSGYNASALTVDDAKAIHQKFREAGIKIIYPGFEDNKGYAVLKKMMNEEYGFGGMIAIDMGTSQVASQLMEKMESEGVGYLAVSLGYFKTLFSNSGKSTSSEVPEDIQKEMGLSEGLIRFSVGLDNDIERTWVKIKNCLDQI